jgi:tetratricopeptide (TPR) repeat protein
MNNNSSQQDTSQVNSNNDATSRTVINRLRTEFAPEIALSDAAIQLWVQTAEDAMKREERMTISLLLKLLEKRAKPLPPLLTVYNNYCQGILAFIESNWEQCCNCFSLALDELAKLRPLQQVISLNDKHSELEATLLVYYARALAETGQVEKVHETVQAVLVFAQANGLRWIEGRALIALASAAFFERKLENVLKYGRQALEVAGDCQDNITKITALQFIGMSYRQRGSYEAAIEAYAQAISVGQLAKQSARLGSIVNNMATAYANLGKMKEALDTFKMALNIYKQRGNLMGVAVTLGNIGEAHQLLGQYDEAAQAYRQGWQTIEKLDDSARKLLTVSKLARFLAKFGQPDEALLYLEKTRQFLKTPDLIAKMRIEYLSTTYFSFAEALLTVCTTEQEIWEVLRYQELHKDICRKTGQLEAITELNNTLVGIVSNGHKLAGSTPALVILSKADN